MTPPDALSPRHHATRARIAIIGAGVIGASVAYWLAERFRWPMAIQPEIISISVVFSAVVGVGFGLYPARRASRLDPIDALRYE